MKHTILFSILCLCALQPTYAQPGTLDPTFGTNGIVKVDSSFDKVVVQTNGKIVAVGHSWNGSKFTGFVARFLTNGVLDQSFSEDGIQQSDFFIAAVAIQGDGKIVVAGSGESKMVIARYNADGNLDRTFSDDGIQTTDFGSGTYDAHANSVAVQSDGKIVAAGLS